jgi:sugar lactone lactonase YvrE
MWIAMISTVLGLLAAHARAGESQPWPPQLPGVTNYAATLESTDFLTIPETVQTESQQRGAAAFVVAKVPPKVTLLLHDDLGPDAAMRRLWSSWGDIAVASDGSVYCGIGDHGADKDGDARCFIYRYDPQAGTLTQVVDMNQIVPPKPGRPSWSKVHAKIDEGVDGKIYFSCTLNDGNKAGDPNYSKWDDALPGGQVYQYDPATGKTAVFAALPGPRCTATSLYDRQRNIWWCNLEAGEGNALWALDLKTKQEVFQGPDGSVGFNRAIGLAKNGSIYFNGISDADAKIKQAEQQAADQAAKVAENAKSGPKETKTQARARAAEAKAALARAKAAALKSQRTSLMKYDAAKGKIVATKATFVGSPGLRCMSRQAADGSFYGVTQTTNELFRYSTKDDQITLLGPSWMNGTYTTVIELSPDERYLYYLPGAHGGAHKNGTPVIQYDIATGARKVLAFLGPAFAKAHEYTPSGTYGAKLSADGSKLYVNFNGDPSERFFVGKMREDGFGLTSFAVIEIPESERGR